MRRLGFTRSTATIFNSSMLAVGVLIFCTLPVTAQDSSSPAPTVSQADGFAVSEPVRELAKLPRATQYGFHEAVPVRRIPKRDFGVAVDPVEQRTTISRPSVDYSIGLDFLGVGTGFPGYTVPPDAPPPDTNMAVGDTQLVQAVNTSFAVFNKYNPSDYVGPIDGSLLFGALGGSCAANNSSMSVQWDNAAHRWLLAQNTSYGPPYHACVAVSTTADAAGTYYLYVFPITIGTSQPFPADPKWGRWIDSWTQTTNNFDTLLYFPLGPGICVYQRSGMLAGSPSPKQVCFQLAGIACSFGGTCQSSLLPADIDSPTNPPVGECQFLIGSVADVTNHNLSLYSVCIDWLHPSDPRRTYITGDNNSQLTTVPTYTLLCTDPFGQCVPQKGTTNQLDSLDDRLMYRFAYYNDTVPGKQHWYVNHSVKASSNQIGVRWYEFQAPQIAVMPPALMSGPFQSGTWAPDSNYRWMGSIAGDRNNDILLGYSLSSLTLYPSVEVAGRLKTTPAGNLEPEVSVVAGTGSQSGSNQAWGSYSAMRLDPDGCTFWYTQEFYQVKDRMAWSTQIASTKFANCQNPAFNGYIELCKQTDPDYPVSGTFSFTLTAPFFSSLPIAVPVGSCSPPIQVPSGLITINEAPQIGVGVENVSAYSDGPFGQIDELYSWTFPNQTATVMVQPGGVSLETVATFTNYAAPPGSLKICKIAGSPSLVGMPFTFTASDGTTIHRDTVNAGPPPGGNCVVDGTWPVNDPVTVTETSIPSGVSVSSITVEPPDRGGPPDLQHGKIVATIGSGFTEVDFTDTVTVPPGSCQPSESLSVMVVPSGSGCDLPGGCVVAWVPQASWQNGAKGVAVANVEGHYIATAPRFVANLDDYINACASDPVLNPPETVCTASGATHNSNNLYVIKQNNPPTALPPIHTAGLGTINFGCCAAACTNCGIAMDAVHHKAVIALSLDDGYPGFQFLNLLTGMMETPAIHSDANQISEDPLIDPISNRLLSPAEGKSCNPVPPDGCYPNYEIADITYPVGANSTLQFYENRLDNQIGFPPGGEPDSAAEDCHAQIILASIELGNPPPSTPYIADLTKAAFTPGVGGAGGTWSDTYQAFYPLSGSLLGIGGEHPATGPIAVAQGTSHEGVLGQESFHTSLNPANTITAFRLKLPFDASAPYDDWVTCNLGPPSPQIPFAQGQDPHTLSAYQSPNKDLHDGTYHSFAVLANQPPASTIAVVDLDLMLNTNTVPRYNGTHVCSGGIPVGTPGTLPSPSVVWFQPLN